MNLRIGRRLCLLQTPLHLLLVLLATGALAGTEQPRSVVGVEPNDSLNLRAQAGANSAIVGKIPHDATQVFPTGKRVSRGKATWLEVEYQGVRGWVNARYLQRTTSADQAGTVRKSAIGPLRCIGTEPFWNLVLSQGMFTFSAPYLSDRTRSFQAGPLRPSMNRDNIWSIASTDQSLSLFLEKTNACSDDMSDRIYPYTTTLRLGSTLLSGCCYPLQ